MWAYWWIQVVPSWKMLLTLRFLWVERVFLRLWLPVHLRSLQWHNHCHDHPSTHVPRFVSWRNCHWKPECPAFHVHAVQCAVPLPDQVPAAVEVARPHAVSLRGHGLR